MSQRDDSISLRQMLDFAREAKQLLQGKQREDLDTDRVIELATIRLLEMLGEAAGRVSVETRNKLTDIPWQEIVGMRHRLAHGYDEIDLDIVWDVVTVDLPTVIEILEKAQ